MDGSAIVQYTSWFNPMKTKGTNISLLFFIQKINKRVFRCEQERIFLVYSDDSVKLRRTPYVKDIKPEPVAMEPDFTLAVENEENNRERGCGEEWGKLLKPSEAGRVPAVVHKSLNVAGSLESLLQYFLALSSSSSLYFSLLPSLSPAFQRPRIIKMSCRYPWFSYFLYSNGNQKNGKSILGG